MPTSRSGSTSRVGGRRTERRQRRLSGAADVRHLDGLSQMLYLDSRLSLADSLLLYGDKMAMAVSLEARVPFLDLELMHFVESTARPISRSKD